MLLVNFEHDGHSIVNVYVPNEANYQREFFNKTKRWIAENAVNINCLMIGGDFNCTIADIDRKKYKL